MYMVTAALITAFTSSSRQIAYIYYCDRHAYMIICIVQIPFIRICEQRHLVATTSTIRVHCIEGSTLEKVPV